MVGVMHDQISNDGALRIITGAPWMDAIISVLEPRSSYRPWSGAQEANQGDAVVAVVDTDPVSVLAAVGVVRTDGDVRNAVAGIDPFYLDGLLELATLNMLAGFVIDPGETTIFDRQPPMEVVETIGGYMPSTATALFGRTSLAAARVLLHSEGKCTACGQQLELAGDDARDQLHIHTAATATDWPAVLCPACYAQMDRGGFTNFPDYRFSTHPRCPRCGARHSLSAMYGMPAGPVEEPWIATMGCAVTEPRTKWVCEECRHQWR
jgi:hypothetical protein